MALEFDKDERKVNELIKSNGSAFKEWEPFKVVSFRSDVCDYILDVRIEERMKQTGESKEVAEKAILKELGESKK